MNPEIKAKWVAALRSGDYRQGRNYLQTLDGAFCCLGVLCDLHSKATGTPWNKCSDSRYPKYFDQNATLPIEVKKWAGSPIEAIIKIGTWAGPLTAHNDGADNRAPSSFAQIADAIEAQL